MGGLQGAVSQTHIALPDTRPCRSFQGSGGMLAKRVIIGTILSRLVVVPALLTPAVLLAIRTGLVKVVDPLFALSLLLTHCSPTAINIQARRWAGGGQGGGSGGESLGKGRRLDDRSCCCSFCLHKAAAQTDSCRADRQRAINPQATRSSTPHSKTDDRR